MAKEIDVTDKWIPKMGELVEYVDIDNEDEGFSSSPAVYIAIYNGKHILAFKDMSGGLVANHVRPITTEAEKYRQFQIRRLDELSFQSSAKTCAGTYLYQKGCRILSPDERIVKPLTDGEMMGLASRDVSGEEGIYELILDVQSKLGLID